MMNRTKVIFFTLSSAGVYRNLFFFPESVFNKLKNLVGTREDIKIVLLTYDAYYDKFVSNFSGIKNKNFIIEKETIPAKKTKLQKIFYFFYSYLIYTKTTEMLATMGLRPDEPPAGGKTYLAPIKKLIANTFGRSRFFKLRVIPTIYYILFPERPFSKIIEKYNPDLIFLPHIYGQFDTMLLAEARRRNIKTIGMAAGWDHLDKYFLPFQSDKFLAQSEHVWEMAIKYQGYKDKQISVIGYPHLDFVSNQRYALPRRDFLKNMDFPEDAKFLLYISGSAYCPDEPDVIETILKWTEEGRLGENMNLIIRPYLGGRGADRDFDKKKFEKFEENPRVRFWKREAWDDLPNSINFMNIMRHSSVIISIFTTAVLEAAVFDVPLVTTVFDGYNKRPYNRSIRRFLMSEHFKDVLDTKAIKITNNFDELFEAIDSYLKNPKIDAREREVLRNKLLYKLDGNASNRIIEYFIGS